ncbi:MAG: DUF2889 domain-containing protein [Sphingobium sp.]
MDIDILPEGVTREELHHRQLDFHGFRRSDGLFEIHGRITDRKTFDFTPPSGPKTIPAGSPVHDMQIVIVFDRGMIIQEVRTSMNAFPYISCPGGGDTLQALVGLHIGRGWNNEVRKRLPLCDTCTHLREILTPLASAAFQTMTGMNGPMPDIRDANGRPTKIDSCHAYGASRELVKQLWPEFHEG